MLAALDLARRIEAGELTPLQVLDRAAEAVAACEAEGWRFAKLDPDAAPQDGAPRGGDKPPPPGHADRKT